MVNSTSRTVSSNLVDFNRPLKGSSAKALKPLNKMTNRFSTHWAVRLILELNSLEFHNDPWVVFANSWTTWMTMETIT